MISVGSFAATVGERDFALFSRTLCVALKRDSGQGTTEGTIAEVMEKLE
jgi:hypothetical protein